MMALWNVCYVVALFVRAEAEFLPVRSVCVLEMLWQALAHWRNRLQHLHVMCCSEGSSSWQWCWDTNPGAVKGNCPVPSVCWGECACDCLVAGCSLAQAMNVWVMPPPLLLIFWGEYHVPLLWYLPAVWWSLQNLVLVLFNLNPFIPSCSNALRL